MMDLLTACLTLMIATAVSTDVHWRFTDTVMNIPLDMAPQSVDDDYHGCSSNMSKLVDSKYLEMERKREANFDLAWVRAIKETKNIAPEMYNLTIKHVIAIRVYTLDSPVYKLLNYYDRKGRDTYKNGHFRFYSLQFLVTDAIQRLNKSKDCMHTYRGTNLAFAYPKAGVRFGAFTSSSEDPKVAIGFGTKSCFKIKTCHGASLSKFSEFPDEKEVLIPPYEVFKLVRVHSNPKVQPIQFSGLNCAVIYEIESVHTESNLRCALFNKREGQGHNH